MRDWIALLLGLTTGLAMLSADARAVEPQQYCAVPPDMVRLSYPLPRISEKLQRGEPVKIVAIGSSSTAGTGASTWKASYPSQLQGDLRTMFPKSQITVINRGLPGDTASNMVARLKHDAIEAKPDLIIWGRPEPTARSAAATSNAIRPTCCAASARCASTTSISC
jgi:hypothetical protein